MIIKIKANEDLFNRWRAVDQSLAAIVQNDNSVTTEQLGEWTLAYSNVLKKINEDHQKKMTNLSKLVEDTVIHIEKCRANG